MEPSTRNFPGNAARALADHQLQRALAKVPVGFVQKRADARERLPEFEDLRNAGRDIKNHTLQHLDLYLTEYEKRATAAGAHVYWAETASDACSIILEICRQAGARVVTKGKSMISEEIGLNAHLAASGLDVVETDLGEYIIQLRGETPSHIIAPAVHLNKEQVEADFRRVHADLAEGRSLTEPSELVAEARQVLRQKFLTADVGITGANFLIAETGSSVIVTNEGNGDLTQSLAKVHVVIASIDKVVPTLEDASTLIRLLARSATGQEISTYTTFSTGARRPDDPDGPEAYHVVILDNGRSELLGSAFQEVLRCIRCGACMNHCPVYHAIGGHAYGWVYPGPIGSVLTPSLLGIRQSSHLPNASTLCGRCEAVCPVKIPLPKLMRQWREEAFESGNTTAGFRFGLAAWAWLARHPRLYRLASRLGVAMLKLVSGSTGRLRWLPFAGGWTRHRDLPAPHGRTFQALWAAGRNQDQDRQDKS
ncbi:MAG: iron-sulfur cluster-binding protein [Hyphomicrobiaceae bacterium]|nr:iron-sulfur cluster-binding protein [Hyphomicrobiaceae bacterium]